MSRQTIFDKAGILGIDVDVLDIAQSIEYICAYAADPTKPACYVIKPYVEFLSRAARDEDIKELLNNAELSVADGVALLWAAHWLYAGPRSATRFWLTLSQIIFQPTELNWPLPERAAGTNFTWPLLKSAATRHLKVFLVGKTTSEDIEYVAATIHHTTPQLSIVGTHSGRDVTSPYGHVSDGWLADLATHIQTTKPDIILVGMGFPLQEKVCAQLATHVNHGVFIGEGGTFDYETFGGSRKKAPVFFQRHGLEWLWRLASEPKRLIRQLAIPRFMYLVWKSRR